MTSQTILPVGILGIGTAVPPNHLPQREARDWAALHFGDRFAAFARMEPVFVNSGIDSRHIAMPVEWYAQDHDWSSRTAAYRQVGSAVFVEAAQAALDAARLRAVDIDVVVTISSTGIATPSLEALVHDAMGFRADVVRVPVFGLGCAGGVSGIALAARLAAAQPGARVLVVAVELCTLAYRSDVVSKANVVATALFGDGAAAVVLSTHHDGGPCITGAGEHLWPASLDVMGWDVAPQGFGVIFARSIPDIVSTQLHTALSAILARQGLDIAAIERFICHPGGAKVIEAIERSLDLEPLSLDAERAVLRDHGNMSAPTVLFVLDRLMSAGTLHDTGPRALIALGPGFTATCAVLSVQEAA